MIDTFQKRKLYFKKSLCFGIICLLLNKCSSWTYRC